MTTSSAPLARWVRHVARADDRPDNQLLRLYLRDRDEPAFAELVRRHGPMVLGACRRLLCHEPDADDAFQATFLVLLRRAGAPCWGERLGPWLHGVAVRTALHARARRARSRAVERQADAMTPEPAAAPSPPTDGGELLDEELLALPAKYREPLVLCELQGLSRRDAARRLGVAEGTLSSRLARGRQMLRQRLERRGVGAPAALLAAPVPPTLIKVTVGSAAGAVPAGVLTLMEGVLKDMLLTKLKLSVLMVPVLLTGMAIGTAASRPTTAAPGDPLSGRTWLSSTFRDRPIGFDSAGKG